ncbi:beta subunit of phenylalanyl-tRNA synthetase [Paraphysoderma sedebokerense]|nr:beta subunit of phenylalanyl-tRNA synthetase [Paraphysoderma sedebokerense]
MPTVNVDQEYLFSVLGRKYSTEEFRELCFEFGIELEEDAQGLSDRPLYKIDIPANRYDLLCPEGIARALKIFQGKTQPPMYKISPAAKGSLERIQIKKETSPLRPHIVGAILRNITFTEDSYNSFIDLQEKLHNNICRKRTLVAIGTHDYDTIKGPFTYEALPPADIKFKPLNQTQVMDGNQLMQFYEADKRLSKFLPIIRDSPVYPVVLDANRVVCSLPPIINGEHSKISLKTKNVFIECTATDLTKAKIVLNTIIANFSEYCGDKYAVEQVEVVYPDGSKHVYPDVAPRVMKANINYITSCVGAKLSNDEVVSYLNRMSLDASVDADQKHLTVKVPITRSDILHECDIMEDVAIAYGYNKIPRTVPKTNTIGAPLPINKLSDLLRREMALAGFSEVLPLILCSHDENFANLRLKDDNNTAVKLANPKTAEYQVVRTSLLPGILKTTQWNKKHSLPIKIFEVSDVVFKDDKLERRARNERHLCALYCNKMSGFEVIHGLLDRLMAMLNISRVARGETGGYYISESEHPTYFPGRRAAIYYNNRVVGNFGILHPEVLEKFEIVYPCSAIELNVEPFL